MRSGCFGVEYLAGDPVFKHLAGGAVPSFDTVYRDLRRFDEGSLEALEGFMAEQGLRVVPTGRCRLHLDLDSSVMPLFGSQEGALPGPNPRYHARPSYHPLLGVIAETGTCVGARLRPGDTSLGENDSPTFVAWIGRLRRHVGPRALLTVRLDAAGDCAELLRSFDAAGVRFLVKLRVTPNVIGALVTQPDWRTVDRDADGKPTRQVATLTFQRENWLALGGGHRVVAIRRNDRESGNPLLGGRRPVDPALHHQRLEHAGGGSGRGVQRPSRDRACHWRSEARARPRQDAQPGLQREPRRVPPQAADAQPAPRLRTSQGPRGRALAHAMASARTDPATRSPVAIGSSLDAAHGALADPARVSW